MNEEELLKKLQEAFQAEARERLQNLSDAILGLEKETDQEGGKAILDGAFREAHSLKGAARSIDLYGIEGLCQAMETVFAAMKRGGLSFSRELFDLLNQSVAAAEDSLNRIRDRDAHTDADMGLASLMEQLNQAVRGETPTEKTTPRQREKVGLEGSMETVPVAQKEEPLPPAQQEHVPAEGPVEERIPDPPRDLSGFSSPPPKGAKSQRPLAFESVRIPSARLDRLLYKAEELVSLKLNARRHLKDLKDLQRRIQEQKQGGRVSSHGNEQGSSVGKGEGLERQVQRLIQSADQDARLLKTLIDDLITDMKEILLLPFATVLDIFPRMVRDLSREAGKDVLLEIHGGEIEIDKRILEEIKDPLIHLLRNAVDHGIENPEQRKRRGKPGQGLIELTISSIEGSRIEILLQDDGQGIPMGRVKEEAVRLGMLSQEAVQKMGEKEALRLVFLSGVSTSPMITEISGRGLGLAIVYEKVEGLGGRLSVETKEGKGVRFRMELPVTLSAFRGVLVNAGGTPWIFPSASVERMVRIAREQVRTVENRPTIPLQGKTLPFVDLGALLGMTQPGNPIKEGPFLMAAVVESGGEQMAFRVDDVLGEGEVLVKGLGPQLKRVRNIAGVAVLATGQAAPVLNVRDLFQSAMEAPAQPTILADREKTEVRPKSILLAEDSITSRILLKSILEGAGYEVRTAVDGMEAFNLLKTGPVDLVVSDVEMPRMSGFDLTARIRADKDLSDIPVVLVTGLETPEDREKGIMAGASAYLVKSGFDQSNLIEVVRRLI